MSFASKCKRRHNARQLSSLIRCTSNHYPDDCEALAHCMATYATCNSRNNVNTRPVISVMQVGKWKFTIRVENLQNIMDIGLFASKSEVEDALELFLSNYLRHLNLEVVRSASMEEEQPAAEDEGVGEEIPSTPPNTPLPLGPEESYVPMAVGTVMECSSCFNGVPPYCFEEQPMRAVRNLKYTKRGKKMHNLVIKRKK